MPKATKQKNGTWRCQLWLGEEIVDGKKKQHVKSFTARTRAEAEDMASEYRRRYGRAVIDDLTLSEALTRYIDSKSNILSPATIRGYKKDARHVLAPLGNVSVRDLSASVIQSWINSCALSYSPKSLKNGYGLLVAAVTAVDPTFHVSVSFPRRQKPQLYIPSYEEVMELVDAAPAGSNLRKAIMLSAFGSLRRSELCALTESDIDFDGGWVTVSKDMVMDENNVYTVKDMPKTEYSNRRAPLPPFVLEELRTGLITCQPNSLTKLFEKLVRKCGLPHIRFHDLRHFFASYLHLKGIPDAYIEKYGGWKPGSSVMKEIYRNTINAEEDRQAAEIVRVFSPEIKKTRA